MNQIESLLERPRAYYNVDGVGELSGGFMFLAFALIQWVQTHTPGSSAWHKNTWFIFIGTLAVIHYGSKAIKEHITYPRTGFVEYPKPVRSRIGAAGGAVAVVLGFCLIRALSTHVDLSVPLSFAGLPIAAGYARGFAGTVPWKRAVSGVLVGGSLVIALLPAELMGPLATESWIPGVFSGKATGAFWLTLMLCGTTFFVSGCISFCLYLRHTQAPSQGAQ